MSLPNGRGQRHPDTTHRPQKLRLASPQFAGQDPSEHGVEKAAPNRTNLIRVDFVSRGEAGFVLLEAFQLWLTAWGASPNTVRDKVVVIRKAIAIWGDPAAVSREDVERWLANPSFSPSTRATYFSHAKSFFGWLQETGRIDVNPVDGMRRPRQPKGHPRPLSPVEVTRVLAACDGHMRAQIMLALFAGLRVHEVAKFRGEDIDQGSIYVSGKGGKQAMIPTHPLLWDLAGHYPPRGWWFPSKRSVSGHVQSTSITAAVSRFFDQLGIDGSLHRCRHSYGTNLLRGGANLRVVQTLLRHESLATTALYTAVDEDERSAAIRALGVA